MTPLTILSDLFGCAVAAAQPSLCLPPYLQPYEGHAGRCMVIGAGKASAAMAVIDTGAAKAKSAVAATDDLRIVLIFTLISPSSELSSYRFGVIL